jgi:uncharacterized FlaG/YvyC family protein
MVTLKNAHVAHQVQGSPKPVPQNAAPKPQAQPRPAPKPISKPKLIPKHVFKQPEQKPKSDVNVRSLVAERERRLQVAQLEAQKQKMAAQHDKAMKKLLKEATEKIKKLAEYISDNTHLIARDYTVHEATNRVTVKIYDSVTGEVIREIPGNDFLDRVYRMEQLMGVMFDTFI